jgi:elongation factor Ts
MSISASEVKKLRELTGCPMMDCKRALTENDGDMDRAVEALRKKGIAGAQKRKERATGEGRVSGFLTPDLQHAVLVELGCETDFVAKNDTFRDLAERVARVVAEAATPPADVTALLGLTPEGGGGSVEDLIQEQYQTLKENMNLRRFVRLDTPGEDAGMMGLYVHFNGRVGTIVELSLSDASLAGKEELKALVKDLCMHVAHTAPLGLTRADISPEIVEKERAILSELEEVKKKPEKIRPKIVEGKLSKFYAENALLDQEFVKEKKVSIRKLLSRVSSEVSGEIGIRRFERMEIGT